jgi:hypothetical protein
VWLDHALALCWAAFARGMPAEQEGNDVDIRRRVVPLSVGLDPLFSISRQPLSHCASPYLPTYLPTSHPVLHFYCKRPTSPAKLLSAKAWCFRKQHVHSHYLIDSCLAQPRFLCPLVAKPLHDSKDVVAAKQSKSTYTTRPPISQTCPRKVTTKVARHRSTRSKGNISSPPSPLHTHSHPQIAN